MSSRFERRTLSEAISPSIQTDAVMETTAFIDFWV